ncbi:MAG TPA: hypothetical protein VG269_20800 [Tepidisphaeraceae bacterium]|jgi:hypothetical protein|nr:hypothetical protein [Tepidisphaeraceae bacterium]
MTPVYRDAAPPNRNLSAHVLSRRGFLASAAMLCAAAANSSRGDEAGALDLSPRIVRGRKFLAGLFDPSLNLLPEFAGAKSYWLFHDNYLAAKVLKPTHPEMAGKIIEAIHGYGARVSGKIEILFDESPHPLPFRHYRLSEVKRIGEKIIRNEVVSDDEFVGWRDYADLLCFAVVAQARTEPTKARECITAAEAMWDGKGFLDPPAREGGTYATYKLALALLAARKAGVKLRAQTAVIGRLVAQQNEAGGWVTDYTAEGKPLGQANVETTSLAILALDAAAG